MGATFTLFLVIGTSAVEYCNAVDITLRASNNDLSCTTATSSDHCIFFCDVSTWRKSFDCGNAGKCTVYCESDRCMENTLLNAGSSNNGGLLLDTTNGNNCIKGGVVNLPTADDATLITWDNSLRDTTINGGVNTKNINIDCSGVNNDDDCTGLVLNAGSAESVYINCGSPTDAGAQDCKGITVNAQNAQYLEINVQNAKLNAVTNIYCPTNSQYTGTSLAPCIIDGSNGGHLEDVTIHTLEGYIHDVYIIDDTSMKDVTLISIDPFCSEKVSTAFTETSSCWNPFTDSPTITTVPTVSPAFNPTVGPTNIPTISPTNIPTATPTYIPTVTPTNTPTATPTDVPTTTPTNIPTTSPTDVPTTYSPTSLPTNQPTVSTINPTHTPSISIATEQPTTNQPTTNVPTSDAPTTSTPTTKTPTKAPTTKTPTERPTSRPTHSPSQHPTDNPTVNKIESSLFDVTGQALITPNDKASVYGIPSNLLIMLIIVVVIACSSMCCCGVIYCYFVGKATTLDIDRIISEKKIIIQLSPDAGVTGSDSFSPTNSPQYKVSMGASSDSTGTVRLQKAHKRTMETQTTEQTAETSTYSDDTASTSNSSDSTSNSDETETDDGDNETNMTDDDDDDEMTIFEGDDKTINQQVVIQRNNPLLNPQFMNSNPYISSFVTPGHALQYGQYGTQYNQEQHQQHLYHQSMNNLNLVNNLNFLNQYGHQKYYSYHE